MYECWHMNKKSWISILLDGRVGDEEIIELLKESRKLVSGRKSDDTLNDHVWIIPSDPSMYDVEKGFKRHGILYWHQKAHIQAGDYVYIYVGKPVSAVCFKTLVTEAEVPGSDGRKHMGLKLIKKYPEELVSKKVTGSLWCTVYPGTQTPACCVV